MRAATQVSRISHSSVLGLLEFGAVKAVVVVVVVVKTTGTAGVPPGIAGVGAGAGFTMAPDKYPRYPAARTAEMTWFFESGPVRRTDEYFRFSKAGNVLGSKRHGVMSFPWWTSQWSVVLLCVWQEPVS